MGTWNRASLLLLFLSLQLWFTWLNISSKLWTMHGKCAKPDNPAGILLSLCGADKNIMLGQVSDGRRCLFCFPQTTKWLLRLCNLSEMNLRLIEKSHSALMPERDSRGTFLSVLVVQPPVPYFLFPLLILLERLSHWRSWPFCGAWDGKKDRSHLAHWLNFAFIRLQREVPSHEVCCVFVSLNEKWPKDLRDSVVFSNVCGNSKPHIQSKASGSPRAEST